jgi:ABC-type lipoprotein export system ATPase subunit
MALLEVDHLVKAFRSPNRQPVPIIDIPSFVLSARQVEAVRGESGTGKTTFLHLIAGILQPDQGSIRLADQEISKLPEPARDRLRATAIGYIFQSFNLLQGYTCLENVLLGMAFGRGSDREFAASLLDRVGLGNRAHYYPRQISTGQQQRVAVARALANRPQLVLADEPTGNLDRRHAQQAIALIREICAENHASLLLVSHDSELLSGFQTVHDFNQINRVPVLDAAEQA